MKNIYFQEKWIKALDYEGYIVSNYGNVKSVNYRRSGKKLPMKLHKRGRYYRVSLRKDGMSKWVSVHKLVVESFTGQKLQKGQVIDHIDCNGFNNYYNEDANLTNLRICTQSENCRNPRTLAKLYGNKRACKRVHLMEVNYPNREYVFESGNMASKALGYKEPTVVPCYINKAKAQGKNTIKLKGKEYFYAVEQKGVNADV